MQELILVKCHYPGISGCRNEGAYIIEYRSGPNVNNVYYGSCEQHIDEMRKGAYGMAYISDIKVTLKREAEMLDMDTSGQVQVSESQVLNTREPEAAE